jgi:hypothetical protein
VIMLDTRLYMQFNQCYIVSYVIPVFSRDSIFEKRYIVLRYPILCARCVSGAEYHLLGLEEVYHFDLLPYALVGLQSLFQTIALGPRNTSYKLERTPSVPRPVHPKLE